MKKSLLPALSLFLIPIAPSMPAFGQVLEEVVVTARKREENIQETPLAVTALSGKDLRDQGVDNVQDLSRSVPSLQINKGQSNQIYIRGIGERTGFVRVDPTVGVYLDDLFLPRADGQLLDTVDVESLQVLRGPQGTLFGKNTTGGALVLSLAKPDNEFYGYIEGGLGNFDQRSVRGTVNVPITDNFYTRYTVNINKRDGFSEDRSDGDTAQEDAKSFLFQTRWDASETVSVDTLFSFSESDAKIQQSNCIIGNDDALFVDGLALLWPNDVDASQGIAYRENCENNSRANQGDLTTDKGPNPLLNQNLIARLFGVTVNWELNENYSVKAVLGYRSATEDVIQTSDNDGGIEDISEAINQEPSDRESASFELQLNGSAFDGRVNFVTGLFAAMEENTETFTLVSNLVGIDQSSLAQLAAGQRPDRPATAAGTGIVVGALTGDPVLRNRFGLDNTTLAAFFQSSWDITDALQLTLGVRYTEETRKSTLETTGTDFEDVTARLVAAGFQPLNPGTIPLLPGSEQLDSGQNLFTFPGPWNNPALGPRGAVGLAYDQFSDLNGDGIPDYVLDEDNKRFTEADEVFTATTPMASLSYIFDEYALENTPLDSLTAYLTLAQGFKSGFSEPRGADGLARIEPEEVDNIELGFKMDMFDRSLRLNMAGYRTDYTNIQLITVSQDSQGTLVVVFTNAGEAVIEGFEAEAQWLPFPGAFINLNYSLNNYYYEQFDDTNLADLAIGMTVTPVDRTDEPFPAAPTESVSLGSQFSFPTDFGIITPRLDVSWKSEIFFGLDATSAERYFEDESLAGADEYFLVDFRLTWATEDGPTRVTAFVKNAFDKRYITGTASVLDSLGTFNQIYGEPRIYGISVFHEFY